MNRPMLTSFMVLSLLSAVFPNTLDSNIGPLMAKVELEILNDIGYLDAFGCYRVLGELENVGDQAVAVWEISASFYNTSHNMVCTETFSANTLHSPMLDTINPDKKSPFEIVLSNRTLAGKVDYYSVTVSSYKATPTKPIGLEITESSTHTDAFKNIIISGTIKNIGNETANSVNVMATWYDTYGSVVAIGYCFTDPDNVEPDLTLPFQIELASISPYPLDNITSYVLEAESLEYALAPWVPPLSDELPSIPRTLIAAILLILILVAAFAALAWRRKHAKARSTAV